MGEKETHIVNVVGKNADNLVSVGDKRSEAMTNNTYMYMYICIYVYIYVYVYIICIYVYMYICIYV